MKHASEERSEKPETRATKKVVDFFNGGGLLHCLKGDRRPFIHNPGQRVN
jgi:hypothetical protein